MEVYGWRARIGHIEPSIWDNCYEWDQILPEGVTTVIITLGIKSLIHEEFFDKAKGIEQAAKELASMDVDAIVIGGSPVVSALGIGSDLEIIKKVEAATKIPTTTSLSAVILALRKLNAKKLAVATPYTNERNAERKKFLEKSGFDVLSIKGLQIKNVGEISCLPISASYKLAREAFVEAQDAEAIYISCSSFPAVMNIERLENDTGLPVVTNIQAQIWWALNAIGIKDAIKGYGRLFDYHSNE